MGVDFLQEWRWEELSVKKCLNGLKGLFELNHIYNRKVEFTSFCLGAVYKSGLCFPSSIVISFFSFFSKSVFCFSDVY